MSENTDDEVSQLLHSWGLSDLKAKFKANYIVLQALEYLTEDDIIELIPKIGQRAIFRGRLAQWRQQNGITSQPPVKICKLEPESDAKQQNNVSNKPSLSTNHQAPPKQIPVRRSPPRQTALKQSPPSQTVPRQSPPSQTVPRQSPPKHTPLRQSPPRQSPPKLNHKIYGTLTKCAQKLKKPVDNTSKTAMQSKVQQFYISPPVVDNAPPRPPTPTAPPPSNSHLRTILPKPDLTPFVTSIIRVETNCDKTYAKTSPLSTQTKVNRTTILQKLTNSERTSSPSNINGGSQHNLIETTPDTEEQREDQSPPEEVEQPEATALYPIVKLETELADIKWNEYGGPKLEPEPEPQPDETESRDDDDLMVDSSDFQTECIETLNSDSAVEFDSENDTSGHLLKRIAPEICRPRKKKCRVLGKLDIRNILMNSDMGRHVLNYYEANERLDLGRRRMLIDAIVQDCWISNRRICPTDCAEIAEEIIEILPNERVEDYYIAAQPGKNLKSPLYNKYRNMNKRFFLEKGLPIPTRRRKRKLKLTLQVDDVEIDDNMIIS